VDDGGGPLGLITTAVFTALVGYAGWIDLRTRRIPNWLTLAILVAALVLRAAAGLGPLASGAMGAGLGLALAVVLFGLGAMGGGDGKLIIGAGAFLGHERYVGALLLIAVLGGLLGVFEAFRRGVILPAVLNAAGMIRRWITFGRRGEARTMDSPGAVTVPYGTAIAAGAIVWWFWGGTWP
jgi:Flp pilus assembly protein protease CpaA